VSNRIVMLLDASLGLEAASVPSLAPMDTVMSPCVMQVTPC
jgi:hypothetical protein